MVVSFRPPSDQGNERMSQVRRCLAAATVLLTAVLSACAGATPSATATPQPTPTPTPAGGEHRFSVGDPSVELTITLPPGWEADASAARLPAADGSALVISAWAPIAVYADPCQWDGTDVEVGPTAADVAAALAAQPMRSARASTVQLGEAVAQRIFMSVPKSLDLATCDNDEFRSWVDASGDARIQAAPGETDEVYVIDVAGQAIVIDASYVRARTAELAEIHRIIGSLVLPPEPSPTPVSTP